MIAHSFFTFTLYMFPGMAEAVCINNIIQCCVYQSKVQLSLVCFYRIFGIFFFLNRPFNIATLLPEDPSIYSIIGGLNFQRSHQASYFVLLLMPVIGL